MRVDFGSCAVLDAAGELREATVRGRLMGHRKSLGNTVVVGDRVRLVADGERLMVEEVSPRRNWFSRRASGNQPLEQVVAANIDQVVLVASLADPEFRPGFADRVLCQAEHAGIPARLVLNKSDLDTQNEAPAIAAAYRVAGYAVHVTCARTRDGLDELHHAWLTRRTLVVGHSGVGKSTLLNAVAPGSGLAEGRVNTKTGKGRHTTTAAWLLQPEPGLEIIDTPGMRGFGLWGIEARNLEQSYPEFRPFLGACRFSDCSHRSEPGCALKAGVDAGHVATRRFESYLKLREELEQEQRLGGLRDRDSFG
jgi:ribosome biogenesis GTPase